MLCSHSLRDAGHKHLSDEMVSISVVEVAVISSKSRLVMLGKCVATEMEQFSKVRHCGCCTATQKNRVWRNLQQKLSARISEVGFKFTSYT